MYKTNFCKVEYVQDLNAVLCSWKQYCESHDYREPLEYGLTLIHKHKATTWITDTTYGFTSTQADNQWLATEFTPLAVQSSCKNIVFIIANSSPLKEEITLHAQMLKPFFNVQLIEELKELR